MRRVRDEKVAEAVVVQQAPVISPMAVYSVEQARQALGLRKTCLRREARLGRLRTSRRAGKHLILGAWLLEWVEKGEVKRKPKPPFTVAGVPVESV